MGKKHVILSELRNARAAHIRWRSFAYGLLSGLPIEDDHDPISHDQCRFGQWYYGEGRKHFGGLDTFRGVEVPHKLVHMVYRKIYELTRDGNLGEAERLAQHLTHLSAQMMDALDLLEQEAKHLPTK
jgi:hypothetical protein